MIEEDDDNTKVMDEQYAYEILDEEIINNKEALIFAYMGLLRFDNKINCLKNVTGASRDHSSGKIFKS